MISVSRSATNRLGDLLEALWRLLGRTRGPRLNFGSEKLVRWTPLGPPFGLHFGAKNDFCFQTNASNEIKPESENEIFSKWASRPHEVLIFMDLGAQNPSQNQLKISRKIDHMFYQHSYTTIIENGPRHASTMHPKSE